MYPLEGSKTSPAGVVPAVIDVGGTRRGTIACGDACIFSESPLLSPEFTEDRLGPTFAKEKEITANDTTKITASNLAPLLNELHSFSQSLLKIIANGTVPLYLNNP